MYQPTEEEVHHASAARLAAEFSAVLWHWLSKSQMEEVIALNSVETQANICHTHDFCDANEAMLQAWELAIGTKPTFSEEDLALWIDAWNIAKDANFRNE